MDEAERREKLHRLANVIAETRRERGWAQAELARRAGINRNVVNALENESAYPSEESLRRIEGALGIDPVVPTAAQQAVQQARDHATDLEQLSVFVEEGPIKTAMVDAAAFLREQFPETGR